jgi:hypothetical protein
MRRHRGGAKRPTDCSISRREIFRRKIETIPRFHSTKIVLEFLSRVIFKISPSGSEVPGSIGALPPVAAFVSIFPVVDGFIGEGRMIGQFIRIGGVPRLRISGRSCLLPGIVVIIRLILLLHGTRPPFGSVHTFAITATTFPGTTKKYSVCPAIMRALVVAAVVPGGPNLNEHIASVWSRTYLVAALKAAEAAPGATV